MNNTKWIIIIFFTFIMMASVIASFFSTTISVALLGGTVVAVIILLKPFYGILIYIIFLYMRPQEFIPFLAKMRIMLILAAIIILSFFFRKIFQKEKISLFHTRQSIVMFLLLIIVPISNFANFRFSEAWTGLEEFLSLFIPFFLIINLVDNFEKLRKVCWTMVICTAAISLNGMLQHFRGIDLIGNEPTVGRIRWIGIFGDPNDFALAINTFFPFLLVNMFGRDISTMRKIPLVILGLVFILAVYYSGSRGGYIALIMILVFYTLKRWGIVKGLIAGIFFLFISVLLAPSRMADLSPYGSSASGRVYAWIQGLIILKSHPVLGVGYNNFLLYHVRAAHSAFIQCMAELGLIGYFMWLTLIYTSFHGLRKIGKLGEEYFVKYAEILQLSLIGFLSSSIFLSQAFSPILYIIVALSTVVIINQETLLKLPRILTVREVLIILVILAGSIVTYKFLAIVYI